MTPGVLFRMRWATRAERADGSGLGTGFPVADNVMLVDHTNPWSLLARFVAAP